MKTAETSFDALFDRAPFLADFFHTNGLPPPAPDQTPAAYFAALTPDALAELGLDAATLTAQFVRFAERLDEMMQGGAALHMLEIAGGRNKRGEPEALTLTLRPGDLLAIVGPTGAGKSRLLEDIECLAQGDTPTGRRVRLNGREPTEEERFGADNRLVAQLSQNMNFVVDLCVADFLTMHAESRLIGQPHDAVTRILAMANRLAGEPFAADAPVTSLSGGQSRALMIADAACLSPSPVVLIDEIENAGIDRDQALACLVNREKIVLLVTHDPELALTAPRRLVIREGGMCALLTRTEAERTLLARLQAESAVRNHLRANMRAGAALTP